jgi:hypothetical protein
LKGIDTKINEARGIPIGREPRQVLRSLALAMDSQGNRVHTTLRRAGVHALTAVQITGYNAMAVFKRYNTVDGDDLTVVQRHMDTYSGLRTSVW